MSSNEPRMPKGYLTQKEFFDEAVQFGGGLELTPGGQRVYGDDPVTRERLELYASLRGPDGERLGRWQRNSTEWVYCVLLTVAASVNAWAKSLSAEDLAKFVDEVVKPAARVAFAVLDSHCRVRERVDGERRNVKADLIGMLAVHCLARDGNLSTHVNAMFHKHGVTGTGKVRSLSSAPFLMKQLGHTNKVFQYALVKYLGEVFGVRAAITEGRAVIPSVSEQAVNSVGTRRKVMTDWLKAHGIRPTGGSWAVAGRATRPDKQHFDPGERVATWNRQAGPVKPERATQGETATWGARLKGLVQEFVVLPARVVATAYSRVNPRPYESERLRTTADARALLDDTRVRTRREGHRAALTALRRTRVRGLNEALKVAEAAFKAGRRPPRTLPKGAKVVVTEAAAAGLTRGELDELRARAKRYGWQLRIAGQDQGQHQSNCIKH